MKKKLTESTDWYKKTGENNDDNIDENENNREVREQTWKEWRKNKKWKRNNRNNNKKIREMLEKDRGENEMDKKLIQGVLFIAHTKKSELAKRMRRSLENFEKYSKIKIKVVERAGEKVADLLHKSNPWSSNHRDREECRMCSSTNEKLWGRYRDRNIVYETECLSCKPREQMENIENTKMENSKIYESKIGVKRKTGEEEDDSELGSEDRVKKSKIVVKYIGETS